LGAYAELFLFTSVNPAVTDPERFFFEPIWYGPADGPALPLLERAKRVPREEVASIGV
jgi:hypothetical protein